MNELKQLTDHHAFIVRSDRKSLFTQIKSLVHQAKEVATKELNQRRQALKTLLEHEDKIYEEEFANKVKSRIDEDIKERKDILLKIKEESTKNELEFLKSKRIQQNMNSCYEIRETLRRQQMQNVKECQLEQILEKERALRKEKEIENYWLKVQQMNIERENEKQQEEDCLKKALVKQVNNTVQVQLEELKEKREKEHQEKLKEKKELDDLLEEIRLEEFDRKQQGKPSKVLEYRKDLLKMMKDKQEAREREQKERTAMQREILAENIRLEIEETAEAKEKKKAFHKATIEFIQFVKQMRELDQDQQKMYTNRIADLRRIDICTKNNILLERQRKARIAEKCYADLKKQICEQYEKRLREETEYRENKMLENRFVHDEITREQLIQQKRIIREDLERQIAENKQLREAEEIEFSNNFSRASNDPEFCAELADRYTSEGIDYLEPHANWRILACPSKDYVSKASASNAEELMGKGAISKNCFEPCPCTARSKNTRGKISSDGRGDEE